MCCVISILHSPMPLEKEFAMKGRELVTRPKGPTRVGWVASSASRDILRKDPFHTTTGWSCMVPGLTPHLCRPNSVGSDVGASFDAMACPVPQVPLYKTCRSICEERIVNDSADIGLSPRRMS